MIDRQQVRCAIEAHGVGENGLDGDAERAGHPDDADGQDEPRGPLHRPREETTLREEKEAQAHAHDGWRPARLEHHGHAPQRDPVVHAIVDHRDAPADAGEPEEQAGAEETPPHGIVGTPPCQEHADDQAPHGESDETLAGRPSKVRRAAQVEGAHEKREIDHSKEYDPSPSY